MSGAAGSGGAPAFPSPWRVKPDATLEAFSVRVPELRWLAKLARMGVNPSQVAIPQYLRLHMRRNGFRGKLGPLPVLQVQLNPGANNDELIVSDALSVWCPPQGTQIEVSVATKGACSRFRFSRSATGLFGVVGVPVGGALLALGAVPTLGPALGTGMLIAGTVVTVPAVVATGLSAWRSRR